MCDARAGLRVRSAAIARAACVGASLFSLYEL